MQLDVSIDNFVINCSSTSHGNEQSTFNEFEHRLETLERKLDALNNLPTDKSFLAPSTQSENAQSNKENTLAIMWKYITMDKRVQATEEGVEKVINILNDLMGDVEELKGINSHLDKLHQEQLKIAEDFDAVKRGSSLEINSEKVFCETILHFYDQRTFF